MRNLINTTSLSAAFCVILTCFGAFSSVGAADFQLTASGQGGCAVTSANTLLCWGDNSNGLLSDNGKRTLFEPTEVSGDLFVSYVALGDNHACVIGAGFKGVFCKGDNFFGQCGVNSPISSIASFSATSITGAVKHLSAGASSTCAVLNNDAGLGIGNNLFCWGQTLPNLFGIFSPALMTSQKAVYVATRRQKAAVFADGSVRTFHANDFGQLGVGNTTDILNVNSATASPVLGLTGAHTIACTGGRHTCVVSLDGRIACSGANNRGQLGLGDFVDRSEFSYIPESNQVTQVACGMDSTCFIVSGGDLKCFGANDFGQLGLGDIKDRNAPTLLTGFAGDRAASIVLGYHTAFAIMQDGSIRVWGRNDNAQLGLGRKSLSRENVTLPQFNDALTAACRNSTPIPEGLQLFLAFFFTTIAILLVVFIQELWLGQVRREYALKFRKQDKVIVKLKSEMVKHKEENQKKMKAEGRPNDADIGRSIAQLVTCLHVQDSIQVRLTPKEDEIETANHSNQYEAALTEAEFWVRIFHVSVLCAIIALSDTNQSSDALKRLRTSADQLHQAGMAALEENEPKQTYAQIKEKFRKELNKAIGNNAMLLPWPIDEKGQKRVSNGSADELLQRRITTFHMEIGAGMSSDGKPSPSWQSQKVPLEQGQTPTLITDLRLMACSLLPLFPPPPQIRNQEQGKPVEKDGTMVVAAQNDSPVGPMTNNGGKENKTKEEYTSKIGKFIVRTATCWISSLYKSVVKPIGRLFKPMKRRIMAFPCFYLWLIPFVLLIFGVFFNTKADQIQSRGQPGVRPGGFGVTFLPIPPQYDFDRPLQSSEIPALYGVMHCNLFFLGLLPLPMMRGAIRDLVWLMPRSREYFPLDDAVFVHRLFAYSLFSGLIIGCAIWLYTMGFECVGNEQSKACLAFNMDPFDPIANVFILRVFVWVLWFPIMPLLYFVDRGPYTIFAFGFVKQFYFELVYYAHVIVAYITLVLALRARLDVFYPVLVSWILYFLGNAWEYMRNFYAFEICPEESKVMGKTNVNGTTQPTSIRLKLKKPRTVFTWSWMDKLFQYPILRNFRLGSRHTFGAGQWVYLYVPYDERNCVDSKRGKTLAHYLSYVPSVAHPFSIANAPQSNSSAETLELHIGVIGASKMVLVNGVWQFPEGEPLTWTEKLRTRVQHLHRKENRTLPRKRVYVLGPYGTAFTSCFKPYSAAVVIGAGTGLTAAESVLREYVQNFLQPTNAYCSMLWFAWSCSSLDDLMWCWDTLVECIAQIITVEQARNKRNLLDSLTEKSNQIGWLGVTLYVTKLSKRKDFEDFKGNMENRAKSYKVKQKLTPKDVEDGQYASATDANISNGTSSTIKTDQKAAVAMREQITGFLLRQIQAGSPDDDECHIKYLLGNIYLKTKLFTSEIPGKIGVDSSKKTLAVAYCGNSSLASVISEATRELKSEGMGDFEIEFSHDGQ